MKLNIYKETAVRLPRTKLEKLFTRVAKGETKKPSAISVNLVLIDDNKIRTLNRKFRGKNQATDVLSFNLVDDDEEDQCFGEVYISTVTAARQASKFGLSFSDEILRLACHGFLHLWGYDHQNEVEQDIMFKKQADYLSAVIEGWDYV